MGKTKIPVVHPLHASLLIEVPLPADDNDVTVSILATGCSHCLTEGLIKLFDKDEQFRSLVMGAHADWVLRECKGGK